MYNISQLSQSGFGPAFEHIRHPLLVICVYLFTVLSVLYMIAKCVYEMFRYFDAKPNTSIFGRHSSLPHLVLLSGLFASLYLFYDLFGVAKRYDVDVNAIFGGSAESLVPAMVGTVGAAVCHVLGAVIRMVDRDRCK